MNTKIIEDMQASNEIVHNIPTKQATPLIDAGYVRAVNLDPMPEGDVTPVNLTALGRGFSRQAQQ